MTRAWLLVASLVTVAVSVVGIVRRLFGGL